MRFFVYYPISQLQIKIVIKEKHCTFIFYIFQITKLKIDSNPFAKGFRDSSRLSEIERLVWTLMVFSFLTLDIELLAGGFDYRK